MGEILFWLFLLVCVMAGLAAWVISVNQARFQKMEQESAAFLSQFSERDWGIRYVGSIAMRELKGDTLAYTRQVLLMTSCGSRLRHIHLKLDPATPLADREVASQSIRSAELDRKKAAVSDLEFTRDSSSLRLQGESEIVDREVTLIVGTTDIQNPVIRVPFDELETGQEWLHRIRATIPKPATAS